MTINRKKNLVPNDHDGVKESLKEWLSGSTYFSGYNFEGSGLNEILNVLAYNRQNFGYYLNQVAAERFLDSATLRRSVASGAKNLDYVPSSIQSATAYVTVTIQYPIAEAGNIKLIPKHRVMVGVKDNVTYTFYTTAALTGTVSSTGLLTFTDVLIREGKVLTQTFTYNSNSDEKFIIPTPDADMSTITVTIQDGLYTSNQTVYTLYDSILELDSTSTVFFIQENLNKQYEIYFGDGIVGKSLSDGSIIIVEYFKSSGPDANGVKTFTCHDITGASTITVTTTSDSDGNLYASGGTDPESMKSIKLRAPKNWAAQGRAVVLSDYSTILLNQFPQLSAVAVWNGKDMTPPRYGTIFISAKPIGGYYITRQLINSIKEKVIEKYGIVTINPEFVDPNYLYTKLGITVRYNSTITNKTASEIETIIRAKIATYGTSLTTFDNTFNISDITTLIVRDCDNSITAVDLDSTLYKVEKVGSLRNITVDFSNGLNKACKPISSSTFTYNNYLCSLEDNRNGIVQIVSYQLGVRTVIKDIGTVDYNAGVVTLSNFGLDTETDVKIYAVPASEIIDSVQNSIIILTNADVNITVSPVVSSR